MVLAVLASSGENEVRQRALELAGLPNVLRMREEEKGNEVLDVGEEDGSDARVVEIDAVLKKTREVDGSHVTD